MIFYSTKDRNTKASLRDAVMNGLAPDGGLYLPERIPLLPKAFINNIRFMSISEIAYIVSSMMLENEIEPSTLKKIVTDTFSFDIPLHRIEDGVFALELFHGPTLAFKDVGARFLARIISHFHKSDTHPVNVLVATSGDSGGAVASGFRDVPGVRVFVLYPEKLLTPLQIRQFSDAGDNIIPIEVRGNFDDCQRLVKEVFLDRSLRDSISLTSANSINICRLLPQMFYYFYAVSQYVNFYEGHTPGEIVISISSGNLGNLTAGLLAKKMGLPVDKFIVANNRNDIFTRFLSSNIYSPATPVKTIARAMDVGNPSNFSRILDLYSGNIEDMRRDMTAFSFPDDQIAEAISKLYNDHNYLIDPHGATGWLGLRSYSPSKGKGIFLATAHPVKFSKTISDILGIDIDCAPKREHPTHSSGRNLSISPAPAALKKILLSTT